MNDFAQILTLLAGFALHTDARDWAAVQAVFAEQVIVDYSSLAGQPKQGMPAAVLVKQWRSLLPGFTRTEHLIGLPLVRLQGERASARANVVAHHFIDDERWTVGGRYEWDLVKTAAGWKIESLALREAWQEGKVNLPELAMQRAAAAPTP